MMINNQPNIGIITSPIGVASRTPVSDLVNILLSFSNEVYFISGNEGRDLFKDNKRIHSYGIKYKLGSNAFTKIIRYFCMQVRIAFKVFRTAKNIDIWVFFMANNLLLPMIAGRLSRKHIVLVSAGLLSQTSKVSGQWSLFSKPYFVLERATFSLPHKIVIYSRSLIEQWGLEKYRSKIAFAHHHYLDFGKFRIEKPLSDRNSSIGYIGRLSEEKGIMNFAEAIPSVIEENQFVKVLIHGDGELRQKLTQFLDEKGLNSKVKLAGWISHDELPQYFNQLKLVVLPSYTEGLPNIMLEAMACGTPVLATSVGAIPDYLKDSQTGFIMENNSPECIAKNIIRALNHPNLEQIAQNARILLENEFTFEKATDSFRKIITQLA